MLKYLLVRILIISQSLRSAKSQRPSAAGIFSDPSEIENIEGLDDPLERVKLRDQDSNLILDMIQTITEDTFLRPQNLPQVKITFDSMNVEQGGDFIGAGKFAGDERDWHY